MQGSRREAASLVGRAFGEFVVREPLSSGGFGMVFRAEQPALGREAVIKVLHSRLLGSETVVQRFLREARLASRLDHPYAAHTYAFGAEPDGVLWIAMELVRGTPLDRMLEVQGPIPLERFVPLLERICEVVHTAHEQGIVHRDLKPANVMVLARAGRLLPKLLDFGIAKLDDPGAEGSGGAGGVGAVDARRGRRLETARPAVSAAETDGSLDVTLAPVVPALAAGSGRGAASDPGELRDTGAPDELAETGVFVGPGLPGDTAPGTHDGTLPGSHDGTLPGTPPPSEPPRLPAEVPAATGGDLASSARLTHVGATMGSPLYMAPEQWTDAAAVDARTDLYALGVLCYEALTGRPPFRGATQMEIALAHARQPPPPLGPGFPPALDEVLARALAKQPADRPGTALELAAAFRAASGIAADPTSLPRLDDALRTAAMAGAPRPIALAVDALDGARNAHQARDALWQVVRVAARLVGITALAAHSHVQADARATDPAIGEGLRRLRGRALSETGWLELARELARPFAALREAHPVPELVEFLAGRGAEDLAALVAMRSAADEAGGGSEDQVRELLERGLPLLARVLEQLSFFYDYPLAVPGEGSAEAWMGVRRSERAIRATTGAALEPGRPVLLDAGGAPVVSLWPFVQVHAPSPGAPPALFFLEGKGRRGARLVALPDPFEREDEELWESLGGMLGESSDDLRASAPEERCPFPGLAAFTAAEADSFFGRERETEAMVNRLRVNPLVAVVGPSGAGKSSFVQAGVLPALPARWCSVTVRPGPAPLVSLAARLGALGIETGGLREDLVDHPGALGSALRAFATARQTTVVVVVDQLEELFTLCDDEVERSLYAEALGRAARSADDPVRVVFTLRDDFLLRAEALPALRSRLGPALQLLTTPAAPELRRILTEPLRRAGYEFDDPALPEEMVESVASAPGALALLSFTASKLWELRDRRFRQIGHKAYRSLGGVGGALAQHAEQTLTGMHPEEQRLVREVFRHLVTAEGTRAVLSRVELDQVLGGGAHASAVVEKLVSARLVVVSEGEGGGERVEVTHEALLDAWPRLVTWRREDAEGARLRDQVRAAARQWEERGRPTGLLWRGDALAEYRLWRARYPGALTGTEEAFAAASLADAARGRRLRQVLGVGLVAGLAAVAIVLLLQNTRIERQRARAIEQEQVASASATKLHDLLLSQYQSQGRRLLLADDPLQALAYLHEAAALGASGAAHDFLVAQAVAATAGELHTLRHDGPVGRVGFSPDGALLATTGYDDQARLWDARRGALLHRLPHEGGVVRVAWSRDGGRVATASLDGTVALWDPTSGRRLASVPVTPAPQAAAFSPDGTRLLTVSTEDAVALWDAGSGAPVVQLRGPARDADLPAGQVAAFSPDGALIAAGDAAGRLRLWHASSGRLLATLPAHEERILWVEFSPDGRHLVATSSDTSASVWDVAARRRLHLLSHGGQVNTAAFSPDGMRLVTASGDRTARVWDVSSGEALLTLAGHDAAVFQARFNPDGSMLATGSDDATAILWDAASGRRLARRRGHRGPVRDLQFDPQGQKLATASTDGSAILWSADTGQRITLLEGHQAGTFSGSFAPAGAHVVTASLDGTARLWDATTGRELLTLESPGTIGSASAQVSPDGMRIATGGTDAVIRVWDARTGMVVTTLEGHTAAVTGLSWQPDGARLVSASADGTVRVWSLASGEAGQVITPHDGAPITWLAVDPAGTLVATGVNDRTVRLWDLARGELRRRVEAAEIWRSGAFDPTGERLVSITLKRSAVIWRAADGVVELELLGHMGDLTSAELSRDGEFALTASIDGTARVWSARTGDLLMVLDHQDHWVLSARFSPDGRRVVTTRGDGAALLWDLPVFRGGTEELAAILRCRVPYTVEGDRITPRPRDLTACAAAQPAQ